METQDITTGMKWHKDKMPKNFINEQKKREIVSNVVRDQEQLNDLMNKLRERKISISDTEEFLNLSVEGYKKSFFDELKRNAETFRFSQEFVLQMSAQYTKDWYGIEPILTEVVKLRDKYIEITITIKDGVFAYDSEGIDLYATRLATRHTTKEERDIFELYRNLVRATAEVAKYEEKYGWYPLAKNGYKGYSTYNILTGRTLDKGKCITDDPEDLTPERFIQILDGTSPVKKICRGYVY